MDNSPSDHLRCSCCGQPIGSLPTDIAFAAPWPACGVTDADFDRRVRLTSETCIVDDAHYFVRAILRLPVFATDLDFCWGVWCSLSRQSFEHFTHRWASPGCENDPPRFGWLSSDLPGYEPTTFGLKTMVHLSPPSLRPWVEVEPGSHPIALEQRDGISVARWHEIVKAAAPRFAPSGSGF